MLTHIGTANIRVGPGTAVTVAAVVGVTFVATGVGSVTSPVAATATAALKNVESLTPLRTLAPQTPQDS